MSIGNRQTGIAVIGTGGRGTYVIKNLLADSNRGVKIVSCYDKSASRTANALKEWQSPETVICSSYEETVKCHGVDWVMIFSPNVYHKEHIICAFENSKHVFSEKPLATSIEDCVAINEAHRKSGKLFATGFVLRYAPVYRKVKELIDDGVIGRILSIDANENIHPPLGAYIIKNWRRHTAKAGPYILEKCCHDLDLLNWFCNSLPSRTAAFGGRDFFIGANKKYEKLHNNGKKVFADWTDPESGLSSPFHDDTDLKDNLVSIFEYRNGIRVMFQTTMSNAIPERRMYIVGTEGNIVVDLYSSNIKYKRIDENELKVIEYPGDGHGGGDSVIMKELYENSMRKGEAPVCGGNEGLDSAVLALAIDRAATEGIIVNLETVWKDLGK